MLLACLHCGSTTRSGTYHHAQNEFVCVVCERAGLKPTEATLLGAPIVEIDDERMVPNGEVYFGSLGDLVKLKAGLITLEEFARRCGKMVNVRGEK